MSAPLSADAACARPGCGHGEDLHDGICFGTACECVRFVGSAHVLPVPVGPVPQLSELEQMRLRVDEVERAYTFDTAALKQRVAELEAELATANGVLDDTAKARRAEASCLCPPADLPGPHQFGCPQAEVPVVGASVEESADKLSRSFAPVAALREVLDGEHFATVHHDWLIGRDLPEVVGASASPTSCKACGSAPESWCPDCAACQKGCFGGFDANPCEHPNASWGGPR